MNFSIPLSVYLREFNKSGIFRGVQAVNIKHVKYFSNLSKEFEDKSFISENDILVEVNRLGFGFLLFSKERNIKGNNILVYKDRIISCPPSSFFDESLIDGFSFKYSKYTELKSMISRNVLLDGRLGRIGYVVPYIVYLSDSQSKFLIRHNGYLIFSLKVKGKNRLCYVSVKRDSFLKLGMYKIPHKFDTPTLDRYSNFFNKIFI